MTTTNLGMTLPTVGADADTWGTELNTAITRIDTAFTPSTRQVLTSGSSATYTTPANCRQLRIRMVGGGGGGGAADGGSSGVDGTATSFNSVAANPGLGGASSDQGGAG